MEVLPIIKLEPHDYMRIIAGKPIQMTEIWLTTGCNYRLFNRATKTYMVRHLKAIVGDYTYWK